MKRNLLTVSALALVAALYGFSGASVAIADDNEIEDNFVLQFNDAPQVGVNLNAVSGGDQTVGNVNGNNNTVFSQDVLTAGNVLSIEQINGNIAPGSDDNTIEDNAVLQINDAPQISANVNIVDGFTADQSVGHVSGHGNTVASQTATAVGNSLGIRQVNN